MSQIFASSGQRIGASASASVLLMNIQDLFPLKLGSNPTSLNSSFLICKTGVRMVILSDPVKIKRPCIETPRLMPDKWWQLFSFQLEKKVHWTLHISIFTDAFLFSWPYHVACGILVPQPGFKALPPALRLWSTNHWTVEKEMAAHSSILAWRIPWTKEPGGFQSMGSQRVGHDWATNIHTQPLSCQGSPLLMLFMQVTLHPFHYPSTRRKCPTTVYTSHVASPFPGAWVASSQLCLGCFAFLLFHEPSVITHGMAHVWTTYLGTPEKNQGERDMRKSNENKEKVKASRKWWEEEKKQKS